MYDYAYLEKYLLLENHNLALQFAEGLVFFKILGQEIVPLQYDPTLEIGTTTNLANIPSATFRAKQLFSSSSTWLNANNILLIDEYFDLYQIFMGIKPSLARVFLAIENVDQKQLSVGNWGTNSDYRFGYIDGRASPYRQPAKPGEFFVTPNMSYYFAVYNPLPYPISPMFYFIVNRLKIAVQTNVDTIEGMLSGRIPARLSMVGGLTPPKYNMKNNWKVVPFPVDASRLKITQAVAGVST